MSARAWLALWTVYLLWGSTYLGIELAGETIPPLLSAGMRFTTVGVVLTLWMLARHGLAPFRLGWPTAGSVVLCGLLLIGASFIAIGLFVSSLTKNQIVAGIVTFAIALILWVISWVGDSAGELGRAIVSGLSVIEHYEDFSKGVIDTKHLVYYLSFIAFGLFLTVKSVDSERWRG